MAARFSDNAHWRDSARDVKFFVVDSKAAFPFLFFLLHMRMWTFTVALVMTLFFSILARFGFTIPIFWRWLRSFIAGSRRFSRPWWV
jgi:intracellular multiplication protein IcmT